MTGEPIVKLQQVELTLMSDAGPVNILKGIELELSRASRNSIMGPSGSGKSSLMMIMGGLERPTSGSVQIDGHDLTGMDEDQLARLRRDEIGIVFQNFHLVPTMTALENVAIPAELAGRKDAFERARAQLDHVGLSHRTTHYPGQLSGGEQQRVALARALISEPLLLLADEPTGNLDQGTGGHIIDLMFEMTEKFGTTLVLITHDPGLAKRCDRTIRLNDGRISDDGLTELRKAG